MPDLSGKSFGQYTVLEQLGEGGMATVFKAYDTNLKRQLAIKFIRTEKLESQKAIRRFKIEAEALAQLDHPNIVKIFDFGDFEGTPYLIMEYVSGGTLKQKMGKPVPFKEAIKLILPIAKALAFAHKKKIIHRDVKPANILIAQDGHPLLSDFGVAKILELEETFDLTGTGVGIGTPEYMAPEQGRGEKVDHRVDIYALGVILFELITGRKPFRADTPMAVIYKHINDPLPRPKEFVPALPDDVEAVILKLLQKVPDHRYQELDQLVEDLDNILEGKRIKVEKRSIKIKPAYILLFGGMGSVAFVLLALLIVLLSVPAGDPPADASVTGPLQMTRVEPTLITPTSVPTNTLEPTQGPPTPIPTPTSAQGLANMVAYLKDGMAGVYVPAGDFFMGASELDQAADPNERPQHVVYLNIFIIDSFEITNSMYRKCVSDSACEVPTLKNSLTRSNYFYNSEYDDFPVIHVDWGMASAYCSWAGRRLPTEAEWEKAARGTMGQTFPWGEEVDCKYGNFANCTGDTTKNRAYHAGISMYDVYDMAGNVWEWVADWYDAIFYLDSPLKNPAGPGPGTEKVVRGGSFETDSRFARATYRRAFNPDTESLDIGFRCADSVKNK